MIAERLLRFFSSLQLAVVCLALATVLVFVGTLAQVEHGLYEVQARYFQSLFVFWNVPGTGLRVPVFPGGYLIGGVLLLNLVLSYITRLRTQRPSWGLLLIHAGLAFLLLGQFATDMFQRESVIRLEEGETKSYSESQRYVELAVVDASRPGADHVVAIPQSRLTPGAEIRHPQLPFVIRVRQFWANSAPARGQTNAPALADQGAGRTQPFVERPPVTTTDERNVPTAILELAGGAGSLGTWLVSEWLLEPQTVTVDGRAYQLALRLERSYKPFAITLLDARHDVYKGTEIPRNFSSQVRVRHATTGEDREVLIRMNEPLRYGGFTFYQYQMVGDELARTRGLKASSVLQVVRNPGWLVPYIACVLVGLGMTWQFLSHLFGFARDRREAARPSTTAAKSPAKSAREPALS